MRPYGAAFSSRTRIPVWTACTRRLRDFEGRSLFCFTKCACDAIGGSSAALADFFSACTLRHASAWRRDGGHNTSFTSDYHWLQISGKGGAPCCIVDCDPGPPRIRRADTACVSAFSHALRLPQKSSGRPSSRPRRYSSTSPTMALFTKPKGTSTQKGGYSETGWPISYSISARVCPLGKP